MSSALAAAVIRQTLRDYVDSRCTSEECAQALCGETEIGLHWWACLGLPPLSRHGLKLAVSRAPLGFFGRGVLGE